MVYQAVVPNQTEVTPINAWLVGDLRTTHELYALHWGEWAFLTAAYEGVRQLVELGVVKRHEREEKDSYIRRMSEVYGFNFSKVVIDIVNFYLFRKEPKRTIPETVSKEPAWQAFLDDCNRYGDSFSDYMADQARWAAVMGHVGFLVDKPSAQAESKADERSRGIYPYISGYHPQAILDWEYVRDDTGKPTLNYLKLKDDGDDEKLYRLWWKDRWEVWQEPESEDGLPLGDDTPAILVSQGPNPLGEIPFVWLYNLRSRKRPIGVSDIHEVARIDLSVIRDLSQIGEITGYSAFPMMLAPMFEEGAQEQDDVGVRVVWEFDPDKPEAKPEWMVPASAGILEAIWSGIERKAKEVYRIARTGGLQQQAPSVARSGVALAAEFQQLNSIIVQKSANIETTENQIVRLWLMWQQLAKFVEETKIERSRDYDVHNLTQDLADALTAKTVVPSKTFKVEVNKNIARAALPNVDDDTMQTIDREIETAQDAQEALAETLRDQLQAEDDMMDEPAEDESTEDESPTEEPPQ